MLPRRTFSRWRAGTACLFAGALLLAGCDSGDDGGPASNNVQAPADDGLNLSRVIPLPEPDLAREDLLLAAIRAASAVAAGRDDREAQGQLAGRQFTFRIRFGCRPAAAADEPAEAAPGTEPAAAPADGESAERPGTPATLAWAYEPEAERLKLHAAPDIDEENPLVQAVAGDGFTAVRGFWVRRPWLLENACPAQPQRQDASPPAVGIAHFFTEADTRPRSRRAYESVQRIAADALPGPAGFDLVLRGRLTALPDGRVIRCAATEASARPVCIISAEMSRVAIENGATGAQLAEWGRS